MPRPRGRRDPDRGLRRLRPHQAVGVGRRRRPPSDPAILSAARQRRVGGPAGHPPRPLSGADRLAHLQPGALGEMTVRSWKSFVPAYGASGPPDPEIPMIPVGARIDALGYCSPWSDAERPPAGAAGERLEGRWGSRLRRPHVRRDDRPPAGRSELADVSWGPCTGHRSIASTRPSATRSAGRPGAMCSRSRRRAGSGGGASTSSRRP